MSLFRRKPSPPDASDIEALNQRASAAEAEALRLGRILAVMPDGVLLVEGRLIRYANPASARLLGGDPARIVDAMRANPGPSFLVQVHHPVYRDVRCHRTPLDDITELVVARDVTDARRVEKMRTDFVANASHELKTPVAAIQAAAETLRSAIRDDPASAERFASGLAADAQRLSSLVQDLLDLARLEGSQPQEAVCDAVAVSGAVVASFGSDIEFHASGSALAVPVSERDLSVALNNLLENATQHARSGRIEVRVSGDDETVTIEVRDDGDGIPAKDLPRIFERFYRVDPARARDTGGTGLGLAIVKHIVEQAGGTIEARSTYGQGTIFTTRFPRPR